MVEQQSQSNHKKSNRIAYLKSVIAPMMYSLKMISGSNPATHRFAELFAEQRNPKSSLHF